MLSPPQKWVNTVFRMIPSTGRRNASENLTREMEAADIQGWLIKLKMKLALRSSPRDLYRNATAVSSNEISGTAVLCLGRPKDRHEWSIVNRTASFSGFLITFR